jgi:hypothetical protein
MKCRHIRSTLNSAVRGGEKVAETERLKGETRKDRIQSQVCLKKFVSCLSRQETGNRKVNSRLFCKENMVSKSRTKEMKSPLSKVPE